MIGKKIIAIVAVVIIIVIAAASYRIVGRLSEFPGVWAAEGDEFCRRAGIDMALLTILPDQWNCFVATLLIFDPVEREIPLTIRTHPLHLISGVAMSADIEVGAGDSGFESGEYEIIMDRGVMMVMDSDEKITLRLFRRYDLDPIKSD